MTTVTLPPAIPADVVADLEHVAVAVASGTKPDPEVVRRVRERADKSRADIFRRNGPLDIAVPAIRELRDT
jgi:hypothetical protein